MLKRTVNTGGSDEGGRGGVGGTGVGGSGGGGAMMPTSFEFDYSTLIGGSAFDRAQGEPPIKVE